ncbi:ATP-binding protein [Aureimonas jatrophae]|uniref:Signal transduction histidine kinase n=1 Tax=Aureimonas jatrophae TaxID=1166073 RepID=A0A1H0M3K2_9HYPH|nr:ATP-binding protein [Aureimonas jatrophae]MBB3952638.1 hypothetical protein [Aureimonas jatrophae]SDO74965.1 Signal transduction histidine kinase [Aureimonas jatrophae]
MTTKYFTVDVALLEELGERLIGRRHIALAEIVKNSYDADATRCVVTIRSDQIVVADNGLGMTADQFERRYLRLAGQHKRQAEFSEVLRRRLTGSKGVGRLAAQFLGSQLIIETLRKDDDEKGVVATMDWTEITSGGDLKDFPVDLQVVDRRRLLVGKPFPNGATHGTRITISNLKLEFGDKELEEIGRQLWSLRSPFERLVRTNESEDPKAFRVDLDANMESAEKAFDRVIEDLTTQVWRAKIRGSVTKGRTSDLASIQLEFTDGYPPKAPEEVFRDEVRLSSLRWKSQRGGADVVSSMPLLDGVEFTIFVYKLDSRQRRSVSLADLKDYLERFGSVALFDAGFRLPYYGIDNDWLENGSDYGRRLSTSALLPSKWMVEDRYMLDLPEPRRLFGYVRISTNNEGTVARSKGAAPGEWLEVQSGRDRLVDNAAHRQLQALVRYSLDLYANRFRSRLLRVREQERDVEPAARKYSRLREVLHENRDALPDVVFERIEKEAVDAERAANTSEKLYDARTVVIAPLAAAGITALAMTHELGRETRFMDAASATLLRIADELGRPDLRKTAEDLLGSLGRLRALQNLFTPLLSAEDREGSDRLRVQAIAREVARSMEPLVPGMEMIVAVDDELYFPRAPLAAWSAILQNVLANSWNASLASDEARVLIAGFSENGREGLRISDMGIGGIDIQSQDRLFDAFERDLKVSKEYESVAIGGQGMGLAIVRMLSTNYKSIARFVTPHGGYRTTFELSWEK